MSDITATDNTPAAPTDSDAVVNNHKKPHTSPRVIMGAEIQACIAGLRTSWDKEPEGDVRDACLALLSTLSSSVETLATGGHPKVGEGGQKRTAGPVNPLSGKRHYVAQTQGGTFAYLDTSGKIPTAASFAMCAHVFGPFRTEDGARYSVAHPDTLSSRGQVF